MKPHHAKSKTSNRLMLFWYVKIPEHLIVKAEELRVRLDISKRKAMKYMVERFLKNSEGVEEFKE